MVIIKNKLTPGFYFEAENVTGHDKIEKTLEKMNKNQSETNNDFKDSFHNIDTCLTLLSEKILCENLKEEG